MDPKTKEWVLGLSVALVVAEAVAVAVSGDAAGGVAGGVAGAVEAAIAMGLAAALLLWKYEEGNVMWVWWLGLVGAAGLLALGAWRAAAAFAPVPPSGSMRVAGGCAVALALVLGGLTIKYWSFIHDKKNMKSGKVEAWQKAKFWAGSAAVLGLAGLGLWWVSAPPPGNGLQGVGPVSALLVGLLGGVIAFGLSQPLAVQRMSGSARTNLVRPQSLMQPSIQGVQRQPSSVVQRQPSSVVQRQQSAQYVPNPGFVPDKDNDVTVYP